MPPAVGGIHPATGMEDKNMNNETRNDEAVSPVIATILMVAITVVLAGVLYVWAANLAESNTSDAPGFYTFSGTDAPGTDGAVIMTMNSGNDLGWASIDIKASVDGQASTPIVECGSTDGTEPTVNCYTISNSETDQVWNAGEQITVDTDCDTSDGTVCDVEITVINNREGQTLSITSITVE